MTFTWTPEFGATKQSQPQVVVVKFGDGYEGRQAKGLNINPGSWDLSFKDRAVAEIDAIEAFLDARAGVEAFDWTPPRALATVRVKCAQWSRSYNTSPFDSLSAKFEQVFEP